jgi:hypothetical protein
MHAGRLLFLCQFHVHYYHCWVGTCTHCHANCLVVYDISLSLSLSLSLFLEDLDAQIAMRQCFFWVNFCDVTKVTIIIRMKI